MEAAAVEAPAPKESVPASREEIFGLGAATIIAFGLAAYFLAGRDFWLDEAHSYATARLSLGDLWDFAVSSDGELNMVAYTLLIRPLARPGVPDLVLRLPSLLAAAGTVPVVWWLTERVLSSRFARITAVLLLLVHPLVVDYAFEARSYAALMFAVAGLTLLLIQALDGSRRSAVAYALLLPLSVGLHFVAIPLIGAHALAVVLVTPGTAIARAGRALRLSGLGMLGALASLTVFQGQGTLEDRDSMTLRDLASTAYNLTGRAGPLSLIIIAALIGGTVTVVRRRAESPAGIVVLVSIVAPAVTAVILSLDQPMIWARYLIHLVPLICCLAAVGIASFVRNDRWRIALVVVCVVLGVAGQAVIYATPSRAEPDDAAAVVVARGGPDDVVLFEGANAQLSLRHYLERRRLTGPVQAGRLPDPTHPARVVEPVPLDEALTDLPDGARVWVITDTRKGSPGRGGYHDTLLANGLTVVTEERFEGVELTEWARAS